MPNKPEIKSKILTAIKQETLELKKICYLWTWVGCILVIKAIL
jgi:hypothetical protein